MKAKACLLLSVLLLTGCNNTIQVDTSQSDIRQVTFDYVIKEVPGKTNQYEHIKTRQLDQKYYTHIRAFDTDVRNCKNIKAVKTEDCNPHIGLYQLTIQQTDDRKTRYLYLDETNLSVTFSGEIGTVPEYSASVSIEKEESLWVDFSALVASLKVIVESAETEIGPVC